MNPKEKYNSIIEMIESFVENQEQVNADLICDLAQRSLMDVRDLTALFKFMLDDTVKQYIVKRKLIVSLFVLSAQSGAVQKYGAYFSSE